MYTFIERIIDQLAIDWPGRSFCFTMDNLNIHHNPVLMQMIASRGHRYLFRAPYWSVDGQMEYVFNTIHTLLLQYFRTIDDLPVLGNCNGAGGNVSAGERGNGSAGTRGNGSSGESACGLWQWWHRCT